MLIFDFDGVLLYSLDEIVLTVYNTATGKQVTSLSDLPQPLVGLFRRNRFHVQPIGDGILLMNWCLRKYSRESERILQPQEYQAIIAATDEPVVQRTQRVYETRQRFIERDAAGWTALHRPFQPLWNELVRRQNQQGFVILTNKNRYATERLCRYFGLNIQPKDIYSGDNGVSKIENMQQIQERYGGGPYYFLDDSLKNLQELDRALNRQKKVLVALLAAWGYTGPADAELAQKSGCEVLTQTDAIALLAKLIPL
jgi:phosphoglycolate phosphatase-like HAD superfamily hydrolase